MKRKFVQPAVPGNGLVAKRNGKELCGGNRALITKKAVLAKQMEEQAAKLSEEGKTPLFFSEDGKMLGMIAVADVIKEDSPRAVKELQNMGIRVVMLTGDNERTARAIGAEAGAYVPDEGYLKKCYDLCRAHNVLFIASFPWNTRDSSNI